MTKNSKIQILRALSIMAVVTAHTCPNGLYQVFTRPFLNVSVPIFLFVSGYLTRIEQNDWGSFYKKRIYKTLIPYIIWSILYSISNGQGLKLIIFDLVTAKAAPQLYYVFVYIQFVILTPLMGKLLKSKQQWTGWLISPVSMFVFKYYWLITGNQLNEYLSIFWRISCLSWFSYYYLGLSLGNRIIKKEYHFKKLFGIGIISIIFQMIETYILLLKGISDCGSVVKITTLLTGIISILLAYIYLNDDSTKAKNIFLLRAGDCSFGIYLSHIMVMKVLYHLPFYPSLPYIINSGLLFIATFMCVIAGQKICGKTISKLLGLI